MKNITTKGSFNNSKFDGNTNIAGNNVSQNIVGGSQFTEELEEIKKKIAQLNERKADAECFYEDLKESIEKKDEKGARKYLERLSGILGNMSALITIGTALKGTL